MSFFNDEVSQELDKKTSGFYSLEEGQNNFRIVSDFAWGYKYNFKNRAEGEAKEYPFYKMSAPEVEANRSKLVLTCLMVVYDYKTKELKPFSVYQKNILNAIKEYAENKKYGTPTSYDLTITKKGSGKETKYPSIIADPPEIASKEVLDAVEAVKINMDNAYTGQPIIESKE